MSNEPEEQKQSISDDQELAKVLAGIGGDGDAQADAAATPATPATPPEPAKPAKEEAAELPAPSVPADAGALDSIKKEALGELRPLVDKLNVEADEKFDIYLLMLRSTDDKELIAPAHEAAKAIPDESKRAQALLDVIKEIDFLTQPDKPAEAANAPAPAAAPAPVAPAS